MCQRAKPGALRVAWARKLSGDLSCERVFVRLLPPVCKDCATCVRPLCGEPTRPPRGHIALAEFPALPLFTDAYLADTRHLTAEEHGAYLLLLMCAWRTRGCALKDCDRTLARIVGVTRPRWKKLRPVLAEFFDTTGGQWQQKKLTEVYRGVEARVAKNRANGAKGGRAKAVRSAKVSRPSGAGGSDGDSPGLPTKSQNQNPEPKAEAGAPDGGAVDALLARLAAAAGLDEGKSGDAAVVATWQAAGADEVADMLPTIARLRAREEGRVGRAPKSLAYYGAAVLEARDARLGAVSRGKAHASANPAAPPKRVFDRDSVADWRAFLGDATSRFRGDYISANWVIGRDHPVFEATSLGPDPRCSINHRIPDAVMNEYAVAWGWRRP